ncbi:hypothetical protein BGZ95_003361 [Linnemannia exigua]|uniref:Uncharacterized protein n=1 Tax=Linnemannia exigua TaxID=604196 RepID=A0AAD4D632_9FUNG|nr:hypothetical protein BGZ95_003361 [Linnemannia exigua]
MGVEGLLQGYCGILKVIVVDDKGSMDMGRRVDWTSPTIHPEGVNPIKEFSVGGKDIPNGHDGVLQMLHLQRIYIPRHTARPDSDGGAGGGQVMGGQLPHELETFFPFDPYRLRRSAPFMQGIYQEWENEEDDEDDEEDEDDYDEYDEEEAGEGEEDEDLDEELHDIGRHSGSMSSEDEDEDDDEAEMNKSIMAMSISPSPAHFLVQGVAGRK